MPIKIGTMLLPKQDSEWALASAMPWGRSASAMASVTAWGRSASVMA
jgi:hypothetical protein